MSRARPHSTLQARLGFDDPDLTTPAHDDLLLWLTAALPDVIDVLVTRAKIKPNSLFKIEERKAEYPIVDDKRGKYTVGFVDYYAFTAWYESKQCPHLHDWFDDVFYECHWYFELKPKIKSLGELLRQIRMYETYCYEKTYRQQSMFVVVSSDDTFRAAIEAEGIMFIDPTKDVPFKGASEI